MAKYIRLGELLVDGKVISQEQLNEALNLQKTSGKRLGEVLIDSGILTERELINALQMQIGVEFVDISTVEIPSDLAKIVPKAIARRNKLLPVKLVRDELSVAMVDPLNFIAIEEVRAATQKKIIPMISTRDAVERGISNLYGNESAKRAIEELSRVGENEQQDGTTLLELAHIEDESGSAAPAVRLVNSVIERAIVAEASDIHMEPRADMMVVRLRVDGVLHNILTIPHDLQSTVVSRIKVMAGMDVANRRVPQDGRAKVILRNEEIDLRVSTLPIIYGEKVTIRLLKKDEKLLSLEGIGLLGENLRKFTDILDRNVNGVILIVGPTGSGKSATMSTMVSRLNTEEVNIVTLEDPVEYAIEGVNQVQINDKAGLSFADGLRSILRQDPDIISIGEIRDKETSDIALRAAITGHLVLSTIHTNDAISTINRLIDIGSEPFLIADTLKGIISQRLVRRICPECREAYTPAPDEEALIGIPEEERGKHQFYRGRGCPNCYHSGYKGRTAVFEIFGVNHAIALAIRSGDSKQIERAVFDAGFEPMAVNCRQLVLDGVITVEEALRTVKIGD